MKDVPNQDLDGSNNNPSDSGKLSISQRVGEGRDVRRMLVSVPVRNTEPGTYDFLEAETLFPDPNRHECTLQKFPEIAVKSRVINTLDHLVWRRP